MDDSRRGLGVLVWLGLIAGFLGLACTLAVILISGSMPKRAPTGEDYLKSLICFGLVTIGFVASLAGIALSISGIVQASSKKRSPFPGLIALVVNLMPWGYALLAEACGWWT